MFNRNAPIYINRGTDFQLDIQYTDNLGAAINITGYTNPVCNISRFYRSGEQVAATAVIQNAITGTIRISLTAAQTITLPKDNTVYTVFITDTSGNKIVLRNGPAIITETAY